MKTFKPIKRDTKWYVKEYMPIKGAKIMPDGNPYVTNIDVYKRYKEREKQALENAIVLLNHDESKTSYLQNELKDVFQAKDSTGAWFSAINQDSFTWQYWQYWLGSSAQVRKVYEFIQPPPIVSG